MVGNRSILWMAALATVSCDQRDGWTGEELCRRVEDAAGDCIYDCVVVSCNSEGAACDDSPEDPTVFVISTTALSGVQVDCERDGVFSLRECSVSSEVDYDIGCNFSSYY